MDFPLIFSRNTRPVYLYLYLSLPTRVLLCFLPFLLSGFKPTVPEASGGTRLLTLERLFPLLACFWFTVCTHLYCTHLLCFLVVPPTSYYLVMLGIQQQVHVSSVLLTSSLHHIIISGSPALYMFNFILYIFILYFLGVPQRCQTKKKLNLAGGFRRMQPTYLLCCHLSGRQGVFLTIVTNTVEITRWATSSPGNNIHLYAQILNVI